MYDNQHVEGISLLAKIIEQANISYQSKSTKKLELINLGHIGPDIEINQESPSRFSLSVKFRTNSGEQKDASIEVSEELVPDIATFGSLYRAIGYRKANFGFS